PRRGVPAAGRGSRAGPAGAAGAARPDRATRAARRDLRRRPAHPCRARARQGVPGRGAQPARRGAQSAGPRGVPRDEAEVVAVLDWASDAGVPVVPYGGGTSVVGGVEYRGEGPWLSLDLGALS